MKDLIEPKKSWKIPQTHFINAINDEWYRKLVEIENLISKYTNLFYIEKNIKTMHLPITTGSISSPMGLGSDSIPVKIQLGGRDTYLADSMQFALEYGCRFFENGVWYIMPSFRGESEDKRHLSQFYHSEAEICGKLEDVMQLVEEYLKYLSKNILKEYEKEIIDIAGTSEHIHKFINLKEIPKVTFEEAIDILKNDEKYFEYNKLGFRNITKKGEEALIDYFNGCVWITNFDIKAVSFYQSTNTDKRYANNADLLIGIGETVGAGERYRTGKEVREALKLHQVSEDEYKWYIEMKDKYPMKTSGFGMGIERFILWLTKKDDIRDCQILPRFLGKDIIP